MTLGPQTAPPKAMPTLSDGTCRDCDHDDIGVKDWVQRIFKMRASCPHPETSAESGSGLPGPCGCTNRFHS